MSVLAREAPSSALALVRRRSAWSLADQAVSSVSSFAVGLLVSREAALPEIGAFAIAFAFYQLVLALSRPLNTDPLTIRFSASASEEQRGPAASATGGAALFGLIVVPVGVVAGLAVGGGTGQALLACALFAPAFLVQDAWRYVFITHARPARAFATDFAVLIAVVPVALLFQYLLGSSGAAFIAAFGAATAIGAIGCLGYSRLWPRLAAAARWWRKTGRMSRYMLGENLLSMGTYLAALSIIAAAAGSADLGRLRVTQVAFAPANFVTLALGTIMLAEGSRLAGRALAGVWRLAGVAVAAAVAVCAALAVLWLAVPTTAAAKVVGPAWPDAYPLIMPVALYFGGIGLTMVLSMALRALEATGQAFRCRAIAAPLTIAAALMGSLLDGVELAVLTMGVVELGCAAAMATSLRRLRRTP